VKGKIHGIHGTFTIDTGASRTVLSEEIYFKIPETRRPPLTKSSILVGALINQINITAFIIYISGLLLAAGLDLN
jgi:hypothetical protein